VFYTYVQQQALSKPLTESEQAFISGSIVLIIIVLAAIFIVGIFELQGQVCSQKQLW
jgi:CHASE3 domain sensor protein